MYEFNETPEDPRSLNPEKTEEEKIKCMKCGDEIKNKIFAYIAITWLSIDEKKNFRRSGPCADLCKKCVEKFTTEFVTCFYM